MMPGFFVAAWHSAIFESFCAKSLTTGGNRGSAQKDSFFLDLTSTRSRLLTAHSSEKSVTIACANDLIGRARCEGDPGEDSPQRIFDSSSKPFHNLSCDAGDFG